ncbi:MAG: hypothetical protein ACRD3O_13515, partial [Terriglobia bacterium]
MTPRRSRKKKRSRAHLWIVPAVAAGVMALLCVYYFRRAPHPRRPPGVRREASLHLDRKQVARRFMRLIQQAGGEGVWIKPPAPEITKREPDEDSARVAVVPAIYERVLHSVQAEARRQRLDVALKSCAPGRDSVLRCSQIGIGFSREP